MRISINRMRGSLADKVGSGQAVFRRMEFWRGTPFQNCSRHQKQAPFHPDGILAGNRQANTSF
jgi:hypothetical protein